jgi:hypothetical protein
MVADRISTDYLVVGSGAAGMAFTDALITHSNARVVMVDRRHAPGGHWNDTYSFCRLHQPSAFYGVDSLPLGDDTIDQVGLNRGGYERATAPEICGYFQRVMDTRLLPSGQVEFLPMSEHVGNGTIVSRVTGRQIEVDARYEVDANYVAPTIPARSAPPFVVEPGASCVSVNALTEIDRAAAGYVIVGGGKTAMDAIIWLLERGTPADAIRWIKPREGWLVNRAHFQPLTQAWKVLEGASYYAATGAAAGSLDEFFGGLEEHDVMLRIDGDVPATMAKGPTVNDLELEQLRRIHDVVRLGHVRRISRDEIVLDEGTVPTSPDHVHVHCAASGVPRRPTRPVFSEDRITIQSLRWNMPCLSAATTGFVEATRDDVDDKNRLCRPHSYPDRPVDWAETVAHSLRLDLDWVSDPEVEHYTYHSRLNPVRGWKEQLDTPEAQAALERLIANTGPAAANLEQFVAEAR